MHKGLIEIYREIREGGIALFLVVAFMAFMGYSTYRAEQRADLYSKAMAEERIETNKILADISATMRAIQHRLGILEYKVEGNQQRLDAGNTQQ